MIKNIYLTKIKEMKCKNYLKSKRLKKKILKMMDKQDLETKLRLMKGNLYLRMVIKCIQKVKTIADIVRKKILVN